MSPPEPVPPTEVDLFRALADLAAEVAEEAGRFIAAHQHEAWQSAASKSTATDMVTEIDRASEALIASRLAATRPDDAVRGEEGTAGRGTTGIEWLVDPVDGTTNFLYGYPAFCVSIAATAGGRTVAGAVCDPSHAEVFKAAVGAGATRNGERLHLPPGPRLDRALVATGFSYEARRRAHQAAALSRVVPEVRDLRRGGSAALDLCWVAAGRVDAFYERGLQPWDRAAGALIAAEAGAWVGTGVRPPLDEDLTVACRRETADAFCALLEEAHAAADAALGWDGAPS